MSIANMAGKALEAVAQAWRKDPEFRAKAEADPKAALAEKGLDLPFDEVKVVEDTPETTHVVLTDPNAELSDEQLETVVGGTGFQGALDFYISDREQMRARQGPAARRYGLYDWGT